MRLHLGHLSDHVWACSLICKMGLTQCTCAEYSEVCVCGGECMLVPTGLGLRGQPLANTGEEVP